MNFKLKNLFAVVLSFSILPFCSTFACIAMKSSDKNQIKINIQIFDVTKDTVINDSVLPVPNRSENTFVPYNRKNRHIVPSEIETCPIFDEDPNDQHNCSKDVDNLVSFVGCGDNLLKCESNELIKILSNKNSHYMGLDCLKKMNDHYVCQYCTDLNSQKEGHVYLVFFKRTLPDNKIDGIDDLRKLQIIKDIKNMLNGSISTNQTQQQNFLQRVCIWREIYYKYIT